MSKNLAFFVPKMPENQGFSDGLGRGYSRLAYFISGAMSLVFILTDSSGNPLPELPLGIDWIFKYIGFYAVGNFLCEQDIVDALRKVPRIGAVIAVVILLTVNFFYPMPD